MDLRPVNTEEVAAGTEDRPRLVTVPTQVLRQARLPVRLPGSTGRRTVHRLDSMEEEATTHRLVSTEEEEEEEDTTRESRRATTPATSSRCRIRIRISTSQSLTPSRLELPRRSSRSSRTRMHIRYQPPPAVAGGNPYPQQYSSPAGPPPTHYGRPSQQFEGPAQYQGGQFDMHFAPPQQMAGYYSNLSGRRKALCIGINYAGTSSELRGVRRQARCVSGCR